MDIDAALRALVSQGWAERVEAVARATACLHEALDPTVRRRLVEALVVATRDAKWEVRKAAADALGSRAAVDAAADGDGVEPALAALAEDPNRFVRLAAQRTAERRRPGRSLGLAAAPVQDAQRSFLERVRGLGRRRLNQAELLELIQEAGERHYRELGADMAHELRTLVQPLRLHLDGVRDRVERARRPDPLARRSIEAMQEGLRRVERLVSDLRDYTTELDEVRERVDLEQPVRLGVEMGRDRAEASGVLVSLSPVRLRFTDGLRVEVAHFRLALAVANLVANAYQALPDGGGLLVVRTERGDGPDVVRVVVEDGGKGMTPEEVELALQRFRTTRRPGGGTGLGLPIARRIVEVDHGGQLAIESAPGRGTTVRLSIPVAAPAVRTRRGARGQASA